MLNHNSILFFSPIDWFFLHQRPQQLAWALSDYYPLIFSYPRTATAYLRLLKQKQTDPEIDLSSWIRLKENLELFHPMILPQYHFSTVQNLNQKILIYKLRSFLKKKDWSISILWLTHPLQISMLEHFPSNLVCYDCMDNWSALCHPQKKNEIQEKESRLLSRADLVFVTSEFLLERIRQRKQLTYLIPNGVDERHFSRAFKEDLLIPEDLKILKKPIVGYIGSIAWWLDFDLITYAAQAKKDYSFVFIGSAIGIDFNRYRGIPNLYFFNQKPYKLLPDYLRYIDVAILPFKSDNLSKSIDPVKAYEYLAAGKQVVATDMAELKKFKGFIAFSKNKEEFLNNLDRCLQKVISGEHNPENRLNIVLEHTWKKRVERIRNILDLALIQKKV